MKIHDEDYSHKKGYGSYDSKYLGKGENKELEYKRGLYASSEGFVQVYAEPKTKNGKYNSLIMFSFYYNGRMHHRTITGIKSLTDRSLSRRANQFVKSVLKKVKNE